MGGHSPDYYLLYGVIFSCLLIIALQLLLIALCGYKYLVPDLLWRRSRKIRVLSAEG